MRVVLNSLLVPALAFTGCTAATEPTTNGADQAVTGDNGVSLNGVSFNGVSLNGVSLNGVSLNGVSFNGVPLNGVSVNGVSLNGVSLNGVSLNGVSLNGTDFIGAELSGELSTGAALPLRIDDIAPLADANVDVLAYAVSVGTDAGWAPLCGYEPDGSARRALAVPGTWNIQTGAWSASGEVRFACPHAPRPQCLAFRYKTWLRYAD